MKTNELKSLTENLSEEQARKLVTMLAKKHNWLASVFSLSDLRALGPSGGEVPLTSVEKKVVANTAEWRDGLEDSMLCHLPDVFRQGNGEFGVLTDGDMFYYDADGNSIHVDGVRLRF